MFTFTADKARKIASFKTIVDYDTKITEIENQIIEAANNHEFLIYVDLGGEEWSMCKEDIRRIKRTLKQNGYHVGYDNLACYPCLGISWQKVAMF